MGNNNRAQRQQDREQEVERERSINKMVELIRVELEKLSTIINRQRMQITELELENAKLRLLVNEGSRLLEKCKEDAKEDAEMK